MYILKNSYFRWRSSQLSYNYQLAGRISSRGSSAKVSFAANHGTVTSCNLLRRQNALPSVPWVTLFSVSSAFSDPMYPDEGIISARYKQKIVSKALAISKYPFAQYTNLRCTLIRAVQKIAQNTNSLEKCSFCFQLIFPVFSYNCYGNLSNKEQM